MNKMNFIHAGAVALLLAAGSAVATAADVVWYDGSKAVTYSMQKKVEPVVEVAVDMFASDMEAVTGRRAVAASEKEAAIRLVELDKASASVRRQLAKDGVPVEASVAANLHPI